MFKGNIGRRTGRNVLEGKSIHCDSAGFDIFEDYFTDSDYSCPEKTTVATVRQNEIKSFLTTEKPVLDGDTTNFKFPSRKRLSFKADTNSESDFSSTKFFTPRNRMLSKRGMQSFPGEDEEEEKINMKQQFSPLIDPVKRSFAENKSYNLISPHSENKYSQMISKRGMKSFPGDEEEEEVMVEEEEEGDDVPVFEIIDSSSPELVMEKMGNNLLLDGGKENKGNHDQIRNDDSSKKSFQKSSSRISQSSIELIPKSLKSMPLQNWYIWDDSNSLINRAKLIITPYGVCEDTAVPNNLINLGTNLQVIDEDESSQEYQKNGKSNLPDLQIAEDSNVESNENAREQEKKEKRKSSPQKKSKMSSKNKDLAKQMVKHNKGRTSLSNDNSSESEETSPNEELSGVDKSSGKKKSLTGVDKGSGKKKFLTGVDKGSGKKKSLTGAEKGSGKKKSLTGAEKGSGKKKSFPSSENRLETNKSSSKKTIISPMDKVRQKLSDMRKTPQPRIVGSKSSPISKKQSPVKQNLRSMSTRSSSTEEKHDSLSESSEPIPPVSKKKSSAKKIYLSRTKQNKPIVIRKGNKRKATDNPENNIPSKRIKTSKTPKSNLLARVLASKEEKESIKQNKGISQQTDGDQTNSEQCSSVSPSNVKALLSNVNLTEFTPVLSDNPERLQSESEIFEAITLGYDSSASKKKSLQDEVLSSKGSDIIDSSDRINILRLFDSKESSPNLDKTAEKNERISACSQSNSLDGSKMAHQKPEQINHDSTIGTLPRKRQTSGPLASEDSLMAFNQGYPKRISPEKSKSPTKSNRLSERRSSGPLASEDSLMAFNQGYPKRISSEKPKSPAKSNRLSERRSSGPLASEDSLMVFNQGYPKRISPEKPKSSAKSNRLSERRSSGPLASEDSLMVFNQGYPKRISSEKRKSPAKSNRLSERRSSGPLASEDSLMVFNQGYPKRSSREKPKSPAKSNRLSERRTSGPVLSEDSLMIYNKEYLKVSNSHEEPPDWQCTVCDGLIPHCLMTCIFCGFQRHGSFKEDPREYNSNSEEEGGEGETEWQCESCNCLIPVSLKACIFCGLCLQEGSQGAETQISLQQKSPSTIYRNILSQSREKNKKQSQKKLNEKAEDEQKTPSSLVGKTSESQSPVLQKKSSNSVKKRSSFSKRDNYIFNSYTNIKVDHKISYCVCSQSDVAMIGMMKIQKGGYRNRNCSIKEMFFTVLTGKVKVQVDDEERLLVCHDTFVVAKNGEYSIKNTTDRMASLIFTIIK